jgi:hypothetical protein
LRFGETEMLENQPCFTITEKRTSLKIVLVKPESASRDHGRPYS